MAITMFKVIQASLILVPIESYMRLPKKFLLVINTNLAPILHRFRDISCVYNSPPPDGGPTEGFPWDDLREILPGCKQVANVRNGVRNIAENFNRLSRVHKRHRQTDRRTTIAHA